MPAPSLVDSCTKSCIKNIRSLYDIGSFEYWQIRTILQRVDSPEQLHQIELRCPQIRGEDAELWQAFIARDIPNWSKKNYSPKNPVKWYEVYCKYKKEQRDEIERDEEILRNTMMGLQRERQTHVSRVVDLRTLPKVPKDPRMLSNNGGVPLGKKGFKKEGSSTLSWTAGSKTKLTDGKSVLTRARREAKEISQMSKLSKPTHQLKARLGQVSRAPAGMVKEYQVAAQPAIKILSRKHTSTSFKGGITGPSLEEREQRLRAAMSAGGGAGSKRDASGAIKPTTLVGSSDEDSYSNEDDEEEDLFDERPTKIQPRPRPVSHLLSHSSASTSRPSRPHQQQPLSSSSSSSLSASKSQPNPKPSDIISSLISKPRPAHTSAPPARSTHSAPISRTGTPTPGAQAGPGAKPMMMPRKRPEVDVFNRGAKKPRVR